MFLKLQASFSSAEYRAAGIPPLLSLQHLVLAGRIGWKQVQESAAAAAHMVVLILAECEVVLMPGRVLELADLMADLMAVQLAWLAVVDLIAELSSIRTASQ